MSNISGLSLIGSLVLSMAQIEKQAAPTDPAQAKEAAAAANSVKNTKPAVVKDEEKPLTVPVKKRGDHDMLA